MLHEPPARSVVGLPRGLGVNVSDHVGHHHHAAGLGVLGVPVMTLVSSPTHACDVAHVVAIACNEPLRVPKVG